MLVLSRKSGEKIVIGSDIIVTVLEMQGGRVKLGIEAPQDRRVLRGELCGSHKVHEVTIKLGSADSDAVNTDTADTGNAEMGNGDAHYKTDLNKSERSGWRGRPRRLMLAAR